MTKNGTSLDVLEHDLEAAKKRVKVCREYWVENTSRVRLLEFEINKIRIQYAMSVFTWRD